MDAEPGEVLVINDEGDQEFVAPEPQRAYEWYGPWTGSAGSGNTSETKCAWASVAAASARKYTGPSAINIHGIRVMATPGTPGTIGQLQVRLRCQASVASPPSASAGDILKTMNIAAPVSGVYQFDEVISVAAGDDIWVTFRADNSWDGAAVALLVDVLASRETT